MQYTLQDLPSPHYAADFGSRLRPVSKTPNMLVLCERDTTKATGEAPNCLGTHQHHLNAWHANTLLIPVSVLGGKPHVDVWLPWVLRLITALSAQHISPDQQHSSTIVLYPAGLVVDAVLVTVGSAARVDLVLLVAAEVPRTTNIRVYGPLPAGHALINDAFVNTTVTAMRGRNSQCQQRIKMQQQQQQQQQKTTVGDPSVFFLTRRCRESTTAVAATTTQHMTGS